MNQKTNQILLMVLYLLFLITGLILILQSVNLGLNAADKDMIKAGAMAGDEYQLRKESYIVSYRWIGVVLLSSGFLGMIFKINIAKIMNNEKQVELNNPILKED